MLLSSFYETSVILFLKPYMNDTSGILLSVSFMNMYILILGKIVIKQI